MTTSSYKNVNYQAQISYIHKHLSSISSVNDPNKLTLIYFLIGIMRFISNEDMIKNSQFLLKQVLDLSVIDNHDYFIGFNSISSYINTSNNAYTSLSCTYSAVASVIMLGKSIFLMK